MSPLDPDVLGRIILIQSTIHVTHDEASMAGFLCRGLSCVPGLEGIGVYLNHRYFSGDGLEGPDSQACREMASFLSQETREEVIRRECARRFPSGQAIDCLKIETVFDLYGFVLIRISQDQAFQAYRPYIENTLNVLALKLENDRQNALLRNSKEELERAVEMRTQELQESERRWKALMDSMPAGCVIHFGDSTIHTANKLAETILGLPQEQIEGRRTSDPVWKFLRPDGTSMASEEYPVNQVLASGRPLRGLLLGVERPDRSSPVWVQVNADPLFDASGRIQEIITSFMDVSARKRAEEALQESEQQHRQLVENCLEGICVSQDDRFKWMNPRFVELWGHSKEALSSRPLFDFVHPEDRELVRERHRRRLRGENPPQIYVFRIVTEHGEVRWVQISVARIFWQGRPAALSCYTDMTEQKQAEAELEKARQRAEESSRVKSEFLANMSHEIRTPLNGIMGMLQLIQTVGRGEELDEYVGMALKSTRRLTRLLNDLLDLSKIEAGKIEMRAETFRLEEVLLSLHDIFSYEAERNANDLRIDLEEAIPEWLVGDAARLSQVLFNLAGNALKYTKQGVVEVHAALLPFSEPGQCRVLFSVADTGPGIAEDMLDYVFETFTQANAPATSYARLYEGAGLGLPLVKRLVNLMQGTISIDTRQGEGTTVFVSLPFGRTASRAREAREEPAVTGSSARSGCRVLVVEDDRISQKTAQMLLERLGYEVLIAGNGREALQRIDSEPVELVLMDVKMPVMDGVEATRRIRSSSSRGKDVPIVAMTAYSMSGDRERLLASGMNDYIAKPVAKEELIKVIKRTLNR